ncbi:MAG: phosphohistidine phosphatase [Simkaniaceae bacterium]|nr:phosphohistidine phosphatase [Simkaniaceae bacterium]
MKNLFLIRHAKSSWDDTSLRDFDRPLNNRGHQSAPFMGHLLYKTGIQPDFWLSSPAKRATTTAEYFVQSFKVPVTDVLTEQGIYHASINELLTIIRTIPEEKKTVFMFGHNPGLTDCANYLTGEHIFNIPTAGIVHIEFDTLFWGEIGRNSGQLVAFYEPKKYKEQWK